MRPRPPPRHAKGSAGAGEALPRRARSGRSPVGRPLEDPPRACGNGRMGPPRMGGAHRGPKAEEAVAGPPRTRGRGGARRAAGPGEGAPGAPVGARGMPRPRSGSAGRRGAGPGRASPCPASRRQERMRPSIPPVAPSRGPEDAPQGRGAPGGLEGPSAAGKRGPPKARLHPTPADSPPPRPHLALGPEAPGPRARKPAPRGSKPPATRPPRAPGPAPVGGCDPRPPRGRAGRGGREGTPPPLPSPQGREGDGRAPRRYVLDKDVRRARGLTLGAQGPFGPPPRPTPP